MNCNCFPCFSGNNESDDTDKNEDLPMAQAITPPPTATTPPPRVCADNRTSSVGVDDKDEPFDPDEGNTKAKAFTFRELASATKNFRQECLLGEGGFGRVFRGTLQSSGQVIAVRQLERSATQGSNDFQVEVLMLSLLRHPNLVPLIGYCADGEQRLLVYEYMPSGPLEKHLFDISADRKPLKWQARMKIASGIAQGLEYLHEKANPPIVYRDLKSSNVLLDETNNPRLSDYGLVKLMQNGNKMHLSPNMTTSGYCAPEFESHGELTLKSDVYSFGVVLLELISGRRALDSTGPSDEQNLVTWAESFFRDPKRFPEMADPLLKGGFPITSLNQAVGVAAMCLQEEPLVRPMISDIVAALSFLAMAPPDAPIPTRLAPILSARVETLNYRGTRLSNLGEGSVTRHKKEDSSDSEDEEHKIHSNDDQEEEGQDSDVDQTDSSDSDCEEEKTEHVKKIKKSGKWSSSKKSSSFGSMNSSTGFSLRCDSTYPDRNLSHLDSRQDIIHESHEYHSGSSSDEESFRESFKSSSRHSSRNRRLPSINSRNSSKKDLHNVSLNSNTSSDKKQYSPEKSSGSRSRKYDNVEISMENVEIGLESDDESEFVYSGDSSSVGSDCGDHSPKRGD